MKSIAQSTIKNSLQIQHWLASALLSVDLFFVAHYNFQIESDDVVALILIYYGVYYIVYIIFAAVAAAFVKSSRSWGLFVNYIMYIIIYYIHITRDCLLNIYNSITIFCD